MIYGFHIIIGRLVVGFLRLLILGNYKISIFLLDVLLVIVGVGFLGSLNYIPDYVMTTTFKSGKKKLFDGFSKGS